MTNPVGGVPNPEDKNSKWLPDFPEAEAKGTFNADNLVFKLPMSKKEPISEDDAKRIFKEHLEKENPEYKKQADRQKFYEWLKGDAIPKDASFGQKALAWGGRIGRGILAVVTSPLMLLTSCEVNEPDDPTAGVVVYVDPTTVVETEEQIVVDAKLGDADKTAIETKINDAVNGKVNELNNAKPQTTDGVGYTYSVNADGKSGNITIDGTDIVLPFDIEPKPGEAVINPDHSLDLGIVIGAKATGNVTKGNVVDYINVIGGEHKTGEITYNFTKSGDDALVTYENGFTHKVGEPADVKPQSAIGQLQSALGSLQMSAGNKLVTNMKSGPAADESAMGIKYELKGGDLKDITTGNPQVKFSVGDIAIEGKVSADKNGTVTISGVNKTVTIRPEQIENIVSSGGANGLVIESSDGKKYEIAYDPELTNPMTDAKDGNYCTIREVKPNGKRGTETFFKVDGETFDVKKATTDADDEFNIKFKNLNDAYSDAVKAFQTETSYHKDGEETTVIHTDTIQNSYTVTADANVSVTWKWPWQ